MLRILMKLRKYVQEKPLKGKLMKTPLCLVSIKRYETHEIIKKINFHKGRAY